MDSTAAIVNALKDETQVQYSYLYVHGLGQVIPPKSKLNGPKTLHLVLKSKWYDKIASGEKTSEYRAYSEYWNKRFCGGAKIYPTETTECHLYNKVVFHKGYTATTMTFTIAGIKIIINKPNDLGLAWCWEIKLGQRIGGKK